MTKSDKEVMQQAIDVLMYSLDSVYLAHTDAVNLYSGYPLLEKKITASKNDVDVHEAAVAALREAIARPIPSAIQVTQVNLTPAQRESLTCKTEIPGLSLTIKPTTFKLLTHSQKLEMFWGSAHDRATDYESYMQAIDDYESAFKVQAAAEIGKAMP